MVRGLYTSALGMTTQQQLMDVIANNIANVNTNAYKKEQVVTRSFTEELMKYLDDPAETKHSVNTGQVSQGLFVDDIYIDFSPSAIHATGNSLDLAISGYGFFVVTTPTEELTEESPLWYTRDGALTLGSDGSLLTKDGYSVLGSEGTIILPSGEIFIDDTGNVFVGGEYIDSMRLVNFEDLHTLRQSGDNLYVTTAESVQIEFSGLIVQGYIEDSNVSSVREMVDMINVARAYDANQRVITTIDTTLQRAVNDVGRK